MVLNPFHVVFICSLALPKTFKIFITFVSAHQALEQSLVISVTFLQCFTVTETRSAALGCSAGVKCLPGMQEGLVFIPAVSKSECNHDPNTREVEAGKSKV